MTKTNIDPYRSPRTNDSYEDGEYETTHQLLQSNRKSASKSGVGSGNPPNEFDHTDHKIKQAQLKQLLKKKHGLEEHKQRSSYIRP